jgi:hypothetical protein
MHSGMSIFIMTQLADLESARPLGDHNSAAPIIFGNYYKIVVERIQRTYRRWRPLVGGQLSLDSLQLWIILLCLPQP